MTSEKPTPNSSRVPHPIYAQFGNLSRKVKGNKELLTLVTVVGGAVLSTAYWAGQKGKKKDAAFDLAKKDLESVEKDVKSVEKDIKSAKREIEIKIESVKDLITGKVAGEMLKFGFHTYFKKLGDARPSKD